MTPTLLAHPLTRGLDLDDPRTTALRRRIIESKPFLRHIYEDWYRLIAAALPGGGAGACPGRVVELGSGAGFLERFIPDVITSEVFHLPGLRLTFSAHELPFAADTLRAVVMVDVLHHVPRPRDFFRSAAHCVRPGGAIIMIEPWVTPWSRLVYRYLHHEPFQPGAAAWEFPVSGPLSGANGALPWIMFQRDRRRFEHEFPQWRITRVQPMMPLRYLASGGVATRTLTPGWTTPAFRFLEKALSPVMPITAMFALVVLQREF